MPSGCVNHEKSLGKGFVLVLLALSVRAGQSHAVTEEAPPSPFSMIENAWIAPDAYFQKGDEFAPVVAQDDEALLPDERPKENISLEPPGVPGGLRWKQISEIGDEIAPLEQDGPWITLEEMKQNEKEASVILQKKDVRFSFLPNPAIRSVQGKRIGGEKTELPVVAQEKPNPQPKTDKQTCEAEALKKLRQKQLEAAESDRQTLLALRAAMQDLGVTNRLAYIIDDADSVPENEKPTP